VLLIVIVQPTSLIVLAMGKLRKEKKRKLGKGSRDMDPPGPPEEISKEDCDTLFAMMDLHNARIGRIERVQDPNIRALCIEQNPSLASYFSSSRRAEEDHKRRLDRFGKRSKFSRSLIHNTQEDESLRLFQRRVRERGYTKEEVFHIFEEVNRWLPARYDYIMAKAEGHERRGGSWYGTTSGRAF
jgi:hypothetical protein